MIFRTDEQIAARRLTSFRLLNNAACELRHSRSRRKLKLQIQPVGLVKHLLHRLRAFESAHRACAPAENQLAFFFRAFDELRPAMETLGAMREDGGVDAGPVAQGSEPTGDLVVNEVAPRPDGGADWIDVRPKYRVFRCTIPLLGLDEAFQRGLEMMRRQGISEPVLLIPDPEDTTNMIYRAFVGRLRVLGTLTHSFHKRATLDVEVKELIA